MLELTVATYNIHKGFSQFNRRFVLYELRQRLRELDADIVFLQEVLGADNRPITQGMAAEIYSQHEFLAYENWPYHAYGKNSVHDKGHHGNAILSRFPILQWDNLDISAHRFESRGVLHCELELAQGRSLHCICVHFGLFKRGRSFQFTALVNYIREVIPGDQPLIIAGDFNDWNNHARRSLANELGLHEVFENAGGRLARSFPSGFPMLRLDRIYLRGLSVNSHQIHAQYPWNKISDHAALSAKLVCHE